MGQLPAIAVLGGSGELGSALARRWAQAGYPVIIGSRSADRAIEAAAQIGQQVRGAENIEAARAAEVIVVAVPYSNHAQILEAIKPGGVISRFDRRKGYFGAYNRDRTIRTFFIPNDGERYFVRQARRPD